MANIYIVIGHNDSGKSATIRALTGVRDRSEKWTIATKENILDICVFVRSLQEIPIKPKPFLKKYGKYSNILVPLRISAYDGCPDWQGYVSEFQAAGHHIKPIAVIHENLNIVDLPIGCDVFYIPTRVNEPANKRVSRIRKKWGWL